MLAMNPSSAYMESARNPDAWHFCENLPGGFHAIHDRHLHVHPDDIREQFVGEYDRLLAIFSLPDYFHVGLMVD